MNLTPSKLEYFLSEKNDYLVVSFLGAMNKLTAPEIEKCLEEAMARQARKFVLNFHDVIQVEPGAIAPLVRFQKALRDRPGEVRVCFLKPVFQRYLIDSGAIRPAEIAPNLLEALQSLTRG
jgi:anti-anti-sigma factor